MKNNCEKWYGTYHEYDKWKIKETGTLYFRIDKNEVAGRYMIQHRKCKICDFIETEYSLIEFN